MSADELLFRIRRINAAIAAGEETDLSKVPATVTVGRKFVEVNQDFRGGLGDEQIHNLAHQAIHSIANLRDNLIKWADANGKAKKRVWDTFNASAPIQIIQDLSNNDKHGYPPKDGLGNSCVAPKLTEVRRTLRLRVGKNECDVGVLMCLGTGNLRKVGDGSATVVVTGTVVDKDGKLIGDLYATELQAVKAWEALLTEYGVLLPDAAPAVGTADG
jgi:hypothetical protein